MARPIDISAIHSALAREFRRFRMPIIELIEAETKDPFKILVVTILSARTKDETTAGAVRRLFKIVSRPADLHRLPLEKIERCIFPVGFYKNKARFLKRLPGELERLFQGAVPDTVEQLVKLPGVGRKTANLVVAVGFNKPAICVDVHVHRIMNRLGCVRTGTPLETEMALRRRLPVRYWITLNSYMVSFGQHLCFPRNPRCDICPIYRFCRRVGVKTRFARS